MPPPNFTVVCTGCQRRLLTVDRLGDEEIGTLEAHLRVCCDASLGLGEAPPLGEIMRRVRLIVVEEG